MDMYPIQTILQNLASKGRSLSRRFSVLLDTERAKALYADVPLKEAAMRILGINEYDLLKLEEEKLDTREYIRKRIEKSSPSFGKFMTQVFTYYDRTKRQKGNKMRFDESKVPTVENLKTLTEEEILSTVVQLYLLSRERTGKPHEVTKLSS